MTPEYIRTLRSHANLVKDRLDITMQMDTPGRRAAYAWALEEFSKRYPNYNWREWADKEKEITR